MYNLLKTEAMEKMRVVLGHGASGNAASMKPYVVGFKRRGIDAIAVDLPKGKAERAVPVFIKTSGRGHEVIGGGQSFGGRVASMAAVEADFGGLVLFRIRFTVRATPTSSARSTFLRFAVRPSS